jgi:hypothetical protein
MVVRLVGASQTATRPGEEPDPAYTGAILTVGTSPGSLFGWYESALAARSYSPAIDHRLASQTSGRAWQRHERLEVQVGIFDPAALESDMRISVAVPAGTIVYEEVVVGYSPGLPKS